MSKVVAYYCPICGPISEEMVEEVNQIVPWMPSKYACRKCGCFVQKTEKEKK